MVESRLKLKGMQTGPLGGTLILFKEAELNSLKMILLETKSKYTLESYTVG